MIDSQAIRRVDGVWSHLLTDRALEARRAEFSEGQVIYDAGSLASQVYFIHAGQVRTMETGPDRCARLMEILGPSEWFGEEALATSEVYVSRAVAACDSVVWAVPVDRLLELLSRDPGLAVDLIRQLASRLKVARQEASQFVFDDCNSRLIKALLRFSSTAAATPLDDGSVMLKITHHQLAQAVGAARETVSLALTQLRQQNLLRTGRNRLVFNPASLQECSRTANIGDVIPAIAG